MSKIFKKWNYFPEKENNQFLNERTVSFQTNNLDYLKWLRLKRISFPFFLNLFQYMNTNYSMVAVRAKFFCIALHDNQPLL